jgi:glycosyltransferase involved in cell wall biosynthesis
MSARKLHVGDPHARRRAGSPAPSEHDARDLRLALQSSANAHPAAARPRGHDDEHSQPADCGPIGYLLDRGAARLKPILDDILELDRCGLDVHVFFMNRTLPGHARWVAREVTARGICHLHAHLATADVARHVKRLTHVGYSFTVYGSSLEDAARHPAALRDHVRHADFVIAPSNTSRNRLLAITGPSVARHVHRIYRGVDTDLIPFFAEGGREADSVLAVGPLVQASGFEDLIDAIGILRDRRPTPVRLTIVGAGASVQKLKARIVSRRLDDRVALLGGDVESDVAKPLSRAMRTHTLMALPYRRLPSTYEGGVPAELLEAMAMGLPVVSTSVDTISEVVDDGWTGRLVAPRQPHWLAGALETLLDNIRLRVRMATQARQEIERSFDRSRNASELARRLSGAAVETRRSARETV